MKIVQFLIYSLLGLNTILYLIRYRENNKSKAYCFFLIYLIGMSIISAISKYLVNFRINNLFWSHVYFITQFIILSFFYHNLLFGRQKKLVKIILTLVIFSLGLLFYLKEMEYYLLNPFDPIEVFICSVPIIIYAIMHLYNSLSSKLNYIYINSGILIYLSVSTLVFTLNNYFNNIEGFDDLLNLLWDSNRIFLVVFYSLILIEWFKSFRNKKVA